MFDQVVFYNDKEAVEFESIEDHKWSVVHCPKWIIPFTGSSHLLEVSIYWKSTFTGSFHLREVHIY